MRAKYKLVRITKRGEERWLVWLWWKGKKEQRTWYDYGTPIASEFYANRLAERINGDIEEHEKNFDPRRWFTQSLFFGKYAQEWLKKHLKDYAPSVRNDVQRVVNMAIDSPLAKYDLREIRAGHIRDIYDSLPEHLKPKTKQNMMGQIRTIFSDAYEREEIPKVPPFPKISVPEPETRYTTPDWVERIILAIDKRQRPIYVLMWTCKGK